MDSVTKVLIAVIIALIISVGVLAYTVGNLSSRLGSVAPVSTEVPKLKSSIQTVSSMVKEVSSNVREVSNELSKLSSSVEELSNKVSNLASLSNELSKLRSEVELLKTEVRALNESITSAAKASELMKLSSKLGEVSAKVSSLSSKVKEEINRLRSELSELSGKLASAATIEELSKLRSSIESIQEQISRLYELIQFPVTIVDATGKPVVIASKPERIVCLLPSVTEITFAVGAGNQVVGVDKYSNYPPKVVEEVKEGRIAVIGGGFYPNIEKILSLNPDLVIGVDSVPSHHTLKKILGKEGIPVILLPDRIVDDVVTSIVLVGRATGHLENATKLAIKLRSEISTLRSLAIKAVTEEGRPKVAIIVWLNPLWVTGNSTWMHDMIELAGGTNAFSNVSGWASVSPEALVKVAPDIIIITGHYVCKNYEDAMARLKKLLGDSAELVPAIKNGRIYVIMGPYNDALVRPGPRVTRALELLLAITHPSALGLKPSQVPHNVSPETFKLPPITSG